MGEYSVNVDYKAFFKNEGKPHSYNGSACFSGIWGGNYLNKVIFDIKVHSSLSNEKIEFFVDFLSQILDKNLFSYKLFKKNGRDRMALKLECSELSNIKTMFYLTAFRYIQEFPEIINDLFVFKEKSFSDLFVEFQKIHNDYTCGKKSLDFYNNLGGHGLIYNYNWDSNKNSEPITFEIFKERFENSNLGRVQNYFKNELLPPVNPIKENIIQYQVLKNLRRKSMYVIWNKIQVI